MIVRHIQFKKKKVKSFFITSVEYWHITKGDKVYGSGYCFTQGKAKTYNTDNLKSKKSISHRYSCEKNNIQNISKQLFNYLINNILLSF